MGICYNLCSTLPLLTEDFLVNFYEQIGQQWLSAYLHFVVVHAHLLVLPCVCLSIPIIALT